jgi:hypothetical protein
MVLWVKFAFETQTWVFEKTPVFLISVANLSLPLAFLLLRGIHLVIDLVHGLLKILGGPHRGSCRNARRDKVLRVREARHLERHRIQCASAKRVSAQRDIVDWNLQRLPHLLRIKNQTKRLGALLQFTTIVDREISLHSQTLIKFLEHTVLQVGYQD